MVWISWHIWVDFCGAYRPPSGFCVWFVWLFCFKGAKQNFPDNSSCVWWLQYLHLGYMRVIICLIICSAELGLYCSCEKSLKKCSTVCFSLLRLHQKAPQTCEINILSGFILLCCILLICCKEQVRSHSFVNQTQLTLPWLNGHFMNIQSLLHLPGKQTCWFPSLPPARD